jgi:hypothetical protein
MLPALRYRGPLYCAPDVNRDNAHDPDRLVSDSGRMTGKAGGVPPVGQIAPDKPNALVLTEPDLLPDGLFGR